MEVIKMKKYDKEKVEKALKAIDKLCLHCKICEKEKCHVYNAYGEIEKLK